MPPSFRGIFPAFITPLDHNRRFAANAAESMLKYLLEAGVDGTYVAGSTGEGMRLQAEDRKSLVETLMQQLPKDKTLIVHVGAATIKESLLLAEHAAKSGAHAISSLPPQGDGKEVRAFYATLAKESPLPLILYYFPKIAPQAFQNPQELIDVCDIDNVIGVKFTDFNFYLLYILVKRGKVVFNGYDEALGAGLLMGAHGGIGSTYNLMPQAYLEIFRAAQREDWSGVRNWQFRANAVIETLLKYPFFAALRAVMKLRGHNCGPMTAGDLLTQEQAAQLAKDLDQAINPELRALIHWPDHS